MAYHIYIYLYIRVHANPSSCTKMETWMIYVLFVFYVILIYICLLALYRFLFVSAAGQGGGYVKLNTCGGRFLNISLVV